MKRKFIPTEGYRVIDPKTRQPIPPDGKLVDASDPYWIRRTRKPKSGRTPDGRFEDIAAAIETVAELTEEMEG